MGIEISELEEVVEKLEIVGLTSDARVVRAAIGFIREHPERDVPGADEAVENIRDSTIESLMVVAMMGESADRRSFARVAANIAEDRHSAGSTAARCTIAILLRHGLRAANDFADDLEHHES